MEFASSSVVSIPPFIIEKLLSLFERDFKYMKWIDKVILSCFGVDIEDYYSRCVCSFAFKQFSGGSVKV